MSNNFFELLKLLDPKHTNWEDTGGSAKSKTESTDIAGAIALAKLSDNARIYMGARQDQQSDKHKLFAITMVHAVNLALKENWKAGYLENMVRSAIAESLSNNICPDCQGQGQTINLETLKRIPCPACDGIGKRSFSQREVSRRIGMDHKNYKQSYEDKYKRICQWLLELEAQCETAKTKIGSDHG